MITFLVITSLVQSQLGSEKEKLSIPAAHDVIESAINRVVGDLVFKGKRLNLSQSKLLLNELEQNVIRALSEIDYDKGRRKSMKTKTPPLANGRIGLAAGGIPDSVEVLEKVDTWRLVNAYQSFQEEQK